jgi:tRNA dimethylallyltransferase
MNHMSLMKPNVVAIVGPTGSGKTALSIDIAKAFNGEVISADSRQIYRGMDLGTGKVTTAEMEGIPHHLLDIADPTSDIYTGAHFIKDATAAIEDISSRHKLPIIAGGTFFYIELLRGTMQPAPVPPNPALRATLETKSTEALLALLAQKDPRRTATIDPDNRRRLIRALEIIDALGAVPEAVKIESPFNWIMVGIDVPPEILNERIYTRILSRLEAGMVDEIANLEAAGVSFARMEDFGLEYRYIGRYLRGLISYDAMIEELAAKTRQFAKRQRLWLKRDPSITWFPFPLDEASVITHIKARLGGVS